MRKFALSFLFVGSLALLGLLIFQNQVHDWLALRGYTPPQEVARLADNTTMEDGARRLFFVNKPVIADNELFNEHCRNSEHSIVLGCYISGQQGIYLLDVSDERLDGVKEVTAAHEFLHAAYERLSSGERERVDKLLNQAFDEIDDARILDTIELYRKQNPAIVPNELHSVIGTEVRSLPQALEDYYAQYFEDRLKIVGYAEQYEQAFTERRNLIRDYDARLADMRQAIEALGNRLRAEDSELKSMRSQMSSLRASNKNEQYNAMVAPYNAKVNQFNADIDKLNGMISSYNSLVQERNSVATEEAELVDAIDSRDIVPDQQ